MNKNLAPLIPIVANKTLTKLITAGVHFGHEPRFWNPQMFPYIYTESKNMHIIDLIMSSFMLKNAKKYCEDSTFKNLKFLFIGTKPELSLIVEEEAKRANSFYVNKQHSGGLLTNWATIKERLVRFEVVEKELSLPKNEKLYNFIGRLQKFEIKVKSAKLKKLREHLNGIKNMEELPDIVIMADPTYDSKALKECIALRIPVIAIVDTNSNPQLIDVPIPGNDNSPNAVRLILRELSDGIIKGQKKLSKKD